jgi:putative transposase
VQAETYLLFCQCYIELNPVRAGMVANPAAYRWSSYRANGPYLVGRVRRAWHDG